MTIHSGEICDGCLKPKEPKQLDWFEEGDVKLCGVCKKTKKDFEAQAMSAELNFDLTLQVV